jgi:secretion/DNA translocation related TadE-like protein
VSGCPLVTPRSRRRVGRDDSGSGVVWVMAMTGLVAFVAAGLVLMVEVRAVRAQAATAADLAALAAAGRDDPAQACAAAAAVALAQEARLVSCLTDGFTVDVVVSVPLVGPLAGFPDVSVRARAGPRGAR